MNTCIIAMQFYVQDSVRMPLSHVNDLQRLSPNASSSIFTSTIKRTPLPETTQWICILAYTQVVSYIIVKTRIFKLSIQLLWCIIVCNYKYKLNC